MPVNPVLRRRGLAAPRRTLCEWNCETSRRSTSSRGLDDPLAVAAARTLLERAREEIRAGADPGDLHARLRDELARARRPRLRRVLNATGVIVHTNLGRAPLAAEAIARVEEVARGYSNLEYDLTAGARGSRQDHVADILRRLTGAEAALVVNNNAAAVLLALAALAEGREVLVSRGELIEIGDGFRIPDVLARSGARLREVGTTNRTRAADYENAIGADTALILRVHQSNFRVVGFTELPPLRRLAQVAQSHGLPLVDDLGSGVLVELADEPSAKESLAAGADLVTFSGDKLLGGPQAGIVVGRADLVERLRRHPLQRALRADKLTLAALEGTLALYLDAPERIPVLRMLRDEGVRARAERLASLTGGTVEETVARVGGGALPLAELPSFACALEEELAAPLRSTEPPVVGIVRDGKLLLDCRTLTDDDVGRSRARRRRMPLTVGTAGHIDHGKTWLVRALTGKDTDRLPEEQARGISIDLGYAPLELPDGRRLSLIDVPGHERFVRNMVAGATGIDLFLLVIDAGEGARPQTHEHLAILRLLGIDRGVVAVTKADTVDAETLAARRGRSDGARARCRRRRGEREDRCRPRRAARGPRGRSGGGAARGVARAPLRRPRLQPARDRHGRHRHAVVGDARRGRRAAGRTGRPRRPRAQPPGSRPARRRGRCGTACRGRRSRDRAARPSPRRRARRTRNVPGRAIGSTS